MTALERLQVAAQTIERTERFIYMRINEIAEQYREKGLHKEADLIELVVQELKDAI